MACDLTSGYSKSCADEVGGIKSFYVTELANVSTYTQTDGEITSITMANGSRFWKYELEKDISNAQAVLTRSQENGTLVSTQTITAILNDNRKAVRNQLVLLAKNDLFIIVEGANGDYEGYGVVNGMTLGTATRDTGTNKADRSGNTLVFNGLEDADSHIPKVDSTIIAALLIPAS